MALENKLDQRFKLSVIVFPFILWILLNLRTANANGRNSIKN
jgi:hypothetical protein